MLFSTVEFFLFLAVALASFCASPPRWRRWILLAASYFFYASWNWRFIPLLLALTSSSVTSTAGARPRVRAGRAASCWWRSA